MAVLCHTFNRYEWLWDGFLEGWSRKVKLDACKFLGTDLKNHGAHATGDWQYLYSGDGEWSDRLIALLGQINSAYVLYIQEDMWPCQALPDHASLLRLMSDHNLCRLQISPIIHFYSLQGSGIPFYFHLSSKYLVSHQPSIWRKDFLLQCLVKNESPWKHEYEGTKRLKQRTDLLNRIAIYPHDWFRHKCSKGQFIP